MPSVYVEGQTAAGTNLTIVLVANTASYRASVHQVIVSSDATPADVATRFKLLRHTAAAVGGTSLTVRPSDSSSSVAACTALQGTMTEPTYEASGLAGFAVNQRATFTWIANPGREIKAPLGTANGIGLRSISSGGTPNINATLAWDE